MKNYFDYMPLVQNKCAFLGGLDGVPFAQWVTSKNFSDTWRPYNASTGQTGDNSDEFYGVDDINNEQWLTLTRLGPHKIKTVEAVYTKLGGTPTPITTGAGHPYVLINFVPHDIEVWGDIGGGLLFYWKAFYREATYFNPVLGISLPCIEQSEVWGNQRMVGSNVWDWTRGGPLRSSKNQIPFVNGIPVPIDVESVWFQGIGFKHGPTFVMGEIKDGVRAVTHCATVIAQEW